MLELSDVNFFAEAMFYYIGCANNERIKKKLADTVRRLPTQKKTIEKAVKPVLELEKLLDSKLDINEELVNKYFKKFEGEEASLPHIPFDFCLASVMVGNPLVNHLEDSLDSFCGYLRKCSAKERMYAFRFGLGNLREPFDKKGSRNEIEEFSRRLESLPLPIEDKWKIQSAAFNYHVHIKELLSLIIPAAKLIESAKALYETAAENFKELYSTDEGHARFDSYFNLMTKPADIAKVAPMFFGFDRIFATLTLNVESSLDIECSNSDSVLRTFLGVAYDITMQSPQDEVLQLSEELKVLADKTRLEILFYLCSHRVYGQELCEKFKLRHSTISYHLTKLMDAGFVTGELFGSKTYYTADKAGIQRMIDIFVEKIK